MSRIILGSCLLLAWIAPVISADEPRPMADVRMVAPDGDGGKYWPRWRGPSGQGIAGPGKYPETWSDTDNVLWKIDVPGAGNSSPIIWKDRLFLTTSYERGKRRSILCFDISQNGKKLWESFVPPGTPESAQGKNGWASGTPTTDGERVYAYFGHQGLYCCDFEGNKVWHETYPPMDAMHGMACSPLLYKDKVIVFQDHRAKSGSFIVAHDKKTGMVVWQTPRQEKIGWGSPVAITVGDQDQIIVNSQYFVYAYDPVKGTELWKCGGTLDEVTPTPVVGHGLLYCSCGRSGPTLAIRPDGAGNVTKSDKVKWKIGTGSPFIPSPLVHGDYFYMVNDMTSVVMCYDARTGKQAWKERCGQEVKQGFSASPVAVGDKIYFTNDEGEVFVLAAGPKFHLHHVNRLGAKTLASPALLDGRWYWRTERQLLCVGFKD